MLEQVRQISHQTKEAIHKYRLPRKTNVAALIGVPAALLSLGVVACRPAAAQPNNELILPTPGTTALPSPYETYLPLVKNGLQYTVVPATQTPEPTRLAPTPTPTPESPKSATPTPTEAKPTATITPEAKISSPEEYASRIENELKIKIDTGGKPIKDVLNVQAAEIFYKTLKEMPYTSTFLNPNGTGATFFIYPNNEPDGHLNLSRIGPASLTFEMPIDFDPEKKYPSNAVPSFRYPRGAYGERLTGIIKREVWAAAFERYGISMSNPYYDILGRFLWTIDSTGKLINPNVEVNGDTVNIKNYVSNSSELSTGTLGVGMLRPIFANLLNHPAEVLMDIYDIDQSKLSGDKFKPLPNQAADFARRLIKAGLERPGDLVAPDLTTQKLSGILGY